MRTRFVPCLLPSPWEDDDEDDDVAAVGDEDTDIEALFEVVIVGYGNYRTADVRFVL
jgi:hypothetical protein